MDIIEERDGYRVRLEYDADVEQPYDDGATPILTVASSRFGGSNVEAFNRQAEPYVTAVSEILDRHDMGTLERFVKIFYGAVKLESWYSDGLRGWYVAFDTSAWRKKVGAPVESLKTENYLSEVQAWATGEVYGWVVERKVKFEKIYSDGLTEQGEEWELEASCWGFYGRDYAEQAAREALASELDS